MNRLFIGPGNNIVHRLVALLLIASLLIVLPGCSKKEPEIIDGKDVPKLPTRPVVEAPTNSNNEIVLKGVFTGLNEDNKKMTFVNMPEYVEYEISYHGGTDIKSKYDTIIVAGKMDIGGIYDVVCDSKGVAKSIYGSKDAWEKSSVSDFDIDQVNKKISYGSASIKYTDKTVVLSGETKITATNLVSQDEITIRGVGETTYSITVDKSHGFLKVTGVDAFLNGYISVGYQQLLTVSDNMIIAVQEGTHKIEIQSGNTRAEKSVTIKAGQQSQLDFSEYIKPAVQNGVVKFMVTPEKAIMVLDGKEIANNGLHTLTYGTHKVVFKASGYEEYSETFVVNSAYETKIIDMVKKGTTEKTTAAKDKTDGYVVKVTAPTGASLYVDSVYVGTVPCQFDKSAGNKIITLAKDGYKTVSYTISIANSTGDLTYAFPDMTKKD